MTAVLFLGLILSSGPAAAASAIALVVGGLSAVLLIAAFLVWRSKRVGYILSIVMSFIFLALFGASIQGALTGFADLMTFLETIIIFPTLVLVLVYSILGLRLVWRKGSPHGPGRSIPMSSVLALLTVGFVIGSASIGVLASGAVLAIGRNSNVPADITIVVGASNSGTAQPFSPSNFTVKAGSNVTWVNKDPVTHTVTSSSVPGGASTFDSGSLAYDNTFSVTLTVPGTYQYFCTIHP